MGAITDLNEAWKGHSGLEVETFLKSQLASTIASLGGKIGYVEMVGTDMKFYDYEGGTVIATIQLGGDVYTISVEANVSQTFFILADETTKIMTITPSTKVGSFGSSATEDFPEDYSYTVAVNTGNGYVNRITGTIANGESASFDIKPYIAVGDNYIRVSVNGLTSGQTKTVVYMGTLTTLTMSCDHAWNSIWEQGSDYVITGIRFAGSMEKTLHVSVNNEELTPVVYSSNQSYTTTATTYTIPSSEFPFENENGVCSIKLWMTAQGVSTQVIEYNIICAVEDDDTPMVAINNVRRAVNFTSGTIFSYVVYNANNIKVSLSATLGNTTYPIVTDYAVINRFPSTKYDFDYAFEVDTGINNTEIGTLNIDVTPYYGTTAGDEETAEAVFDNTYSYLATPGALFYMNASTRSNSESNYNKVVNEMGASQDVNFAASYDITVDDVSFFNDMWASDEDGYRAMTVLAGSEVSVTNFSPLSLLSSYQYGMSVEFMLKASHPSDYSEPIMTIASTANNLTNGIIIYPTKIVVLGSNERSEVVQTVNFSENKITHFCITFTKNYGGISGRNLCSVYINGISNVNFAFNGASSFGTGNLVIGQTNTDVYLYKMRVYGTALDAQAVFNNFLNAIFDNVEFNRNNVFAKNNLFDGGVIGYEQCKSAGFNTMVVIMDDPSHDIPSFNNNASFSGCTLRFEYADDSTKNVAVENIDLDGQGTTSKKYFRWNLRAKTKSGTLWSYGDGDTATGKKGYMIKDGVHDKVDRITAKKNYASSMQGHKMGMTGLYNDLFHQLGLGSHLPSNNYQLAVYQFPFVGFKYNATNDSYEYIGLYTAGPDKGSKVTFGYSGDYEYLLSLEGPNHAPRGTRFLHPWADVEYSSSDETLKFGGEEGWDCDYVGNDLSSDEPNDNAAIMALYESEWRPAYEVVFNNSPYIVSASEMITALNNGSITSISDLCNTNNTNSIMAGSTNGYSNQLLSFYDTNYEIYFFRTKNNRFEKMSDVDSNLEHNAVTTLYSGGYLTTQSPTTAQIIAARAARFKATVEDYWDLDQTLYHYCYCLLLGVSDNFAKNSYPFKFRGYDESLADGESTYCKRWGWREDDLDTSLMTDNNGQNTKSYSVEHGDTLDGVEIFQGGNSALWVLIRDNYDTEIRTMMTNIVNAASAIATSIGIQGNGLHESLYNVIAYYCWQHSAKYFSQTLYEGDRSWSYIEPWLLDANQTYNGVYPLTQALGDQYQAESLWVTRRIAYIFSKFRIGVFTGDTTGWNTMAFTLNSPFTFNIKPAIDLYPVVTLANSQDVQGARTTAGQVAQLQVNADGQTTNYIKGVDWLEDLGDLSGMTLTARGGGQISFSAIGNRLKRLKIGDTTAANVHFNADVFTVASPALTEIDARNTTTITNSVDLKNCPRLRVAKFNGSHATGLELPIYGKVEEVSFPETCGTVFLHSLTLLTPARFTLPDTSTIINLYMNNCDFLSPFDTVNEILEDENNQLAYLGLIFRNVLTFDSLSDFTNVINHEWAGRMIYENGATSVVAGQPYIEGTCDLSTFDLYTGLLDNLEVTRQEVVSGDVVKALCNKYRTMFYLLYDTTRTTITFADANVKTICLNTWGTSGATELYVNQAAAATSLAVGTFRGNTTITSFNEFKYWLGIKTITAGTGTASNNAGAFGFCTSLESIEIPEGVTTIGTYAFYGCSSLNRVVIPSTITTAGDSAFYGCGGLTNNNVYYNGTYDQLLNINIDGTADAHACMPYGLGTHLFINGEELTNIVIPEGKTSIKNKTFHGLKFVTGSLTIPNTVTSIGVSSFRNCFGLTSLTLSNQLITIGNSAFYNCYGFVGNFNIPNSVTSIGNDAFYSVKLSGDIILENVTSVGANAFQNCTNATSFINKTSCTYGNYFVKGAGCKHVYINNSNNVGAINFQIGTSSSAAKVLNVAKLGTASSGNNSYYNYINNIIVRNSLSISLYTYFLSLITFRCSGTMFATTSLSVFYGTESTLKFVEFLGNMSSTSGNVFYSSTANNSKILHLGYTSVLTAVPDRFPATKVSKFYVGRGITKTADEDLITAYLANSNWSGQSSKLATWWDYNGTYRTYRVTLTLTNCTAETIIDDITKYTNIVPTQFPYIVRKEPYITQLTADDDYTLSNVQVLMYEAADNAVTPDNPTDITSSVYDSSTGTISIDQVLGNIEIIATATANS